MHPALQAALGGVFIGLASWLLLASLGKVAGISGIAGALISPNPDESHDTAWRMVFVLGLVIGGLVATQFYPAPLQTMRPLWVLIVAGLLVGFGTVLGSGCTSGHGVCGLGRRSVRSLVATLTFMAAGFATVFCVQLLTGSAYL